MKLALPMLLILGLSGCKASLNAEANASASDSGARADGDADAEASLGNGDEAPPQDDLDKPIDVRPGQQIVETQAQGPALLGARRDLSYDGPKTETCSCLAVKLGTARDAAFQWEKQPPLLDDSRQLVVGLTSQGVSCAQETGLGASYKGYVRSGNDIVVMVERAHEGRPVQSGAIVPRPVATGQVYVVAAEKGSPFGGAVGNPKERCRLELPATSQVLAGEASEDEATAALADVPRPEDDEADAGASQDFLEVDEAVLDGDGEPPRSPRERDGFFLSLQPAVDYMHLSQRGADAAFNGFGFGLDLMMGGSVAEGFHLGVILGGATFPSPDLKVQGATIANDIDLNWFHVGGALDYYFSPDSGTHLLGEVGYAQLTASGTRAESQNFLGLGLALGLGHDWWISDNWSLGLLARFSFAPLHHRQANTDHLLFLPGLHFTATYH